MRTHPLPQRRARPLPRRHRCSVAGAGSELGGGAGGSGRRSPGTLPGARRARPALPARSRTRSKLKRQPERSAAPEGVPRPGGGVPALRPATSGRDGDGWRARAAPAAGLLQCPASHQPIRRPGLAYRGNGVPHGPLGLSFSFCQPADAAHGEVGRSGRSRFPEWPIPGCRPRRPASQPSITSWSSVYAGVCMWGGPFTFYRTPQAHDLPEGRSQHLNSVLGWGGDLEKRTPRPRGEQ